MKTNSNIDVVMENPNPRIKRGSWFNNATKNEETGVTTIDGSWFGSKNKRLFQGATKNEATGVITIDCSHSRVNYEEKFTDSNANPRIKRGSWFQNFNSKQEIPVLKLKEETNPTLKSVIPVEKTTSMPIIKPSAETDAYINSLKLDQSGRLIVPMSDFVTMKFDDRMWFVNLENKDKAIISDADNLVEFKKNQHGVMVIPGLSFEKMDTRQRTLYMDLQKRGKAVIAY